jgi:hypothetical protein
VESEPKGDAAPVPTAPAAALIFKRVICQSESFSLRKKDVYIVSFF